MSKSFKTKSAVILIVMVMMMSLIPGSVYAADGWKKDSNGWQYLVGNSNYKNQWAQISGKWYYFNEKGYMESNCYRNGYWLTSSGAWNPNYSHGTWKKNSTGWWYEDNGWYPVKQWLWIDGKCYYFNNKGYMESKCYRDRCWLTASGAWDTRYSHGTWKSNSTGKWYEDNGWRPVNQTLKIDGVKYKFDSKGMVVKNTPTPKPSVDKYAGYRKVLTAYDDKLRMVENGSENYFSNRKRNSCALKDLTGDGFPELIILYWSDKEHNSKNDSFFHADVRIYTIDSGKSEAREILHIPSAFYFDLVGDVVLLTNGNIVFRWESDFTILQRTFTEYAFDGHSFQQVNVLARKDIPGEDGIPVGETITLNGKAISEADYNAKINYYANKVSCTFVKRYYSGNSMQWGNNDWQNSMINAPDYSITLTEAWNKVKASQ